MRKIGYFILSGSLLLAISGCNSLTMKRQSPSPSLNISAYSDREFLHKFDPSISYSLVSSSYVGPRSVLASLTKGESIDEIALSGNGRYVVFSSRDKLHPEAKTGVLNVYRRSIDPEGALGPVELVSFHSMETLATPCGSQSVSRDAVDRDAYGISVSYDGSRIAFVSAATNMTPRLTCDPTTKVNTFVEKTVWKTPQAYLADMNTGIVELVSGSVPLDSNEAGKIPNFAPVREVSVSGNGKIVAYASYSADSIQLAPDMTKDSFDKIFVFDTQTKKTGLASAPMPGKVLNGDSYQPVLNDKGNVLAFTSEANLSPDDRTAGTDLDAGTAGISNIYRAEFALVGDSPDFSNRIKLDIMDADANSTVVTSMFGASHPSITADGKHVAFQSARPQREIIDGIVPNGVSPFADYRGIHVYVTNADTGKTSVVSLREFTSGGGNTFSNFETVTSNFNPTISPNGKYLLFTNDAKDTYMTGKMKGYTGALPTVHPNPKATHSCANLQTTSTEKQTVTPNEPKSSFVLEVGWRDAISMQCIPAINPNTYGKLQVYRVELDLSGSAPQLVDLKPVSTTPPLTVGNFMTNWWESPLADGPKGEKRYQINFGKTIQVLYGDRNSLSALQGVSDNEQVVFLSGAENLFGSRIDLAKVDRNLLRADGFYKNVPPADVIYLLKDVRAKIYPLGAVDYYPANNLDPIEFYYDQKAVNNLNGFIYSQGIKGIEK